MLKDPTKYDFKDCALQSDSVSSWQQPVSMPKIHKRKLRLVDWWAKVMPKNVFQPEHIACRGLQIWLSQCLQAQVEFCWLGTQPAKNVKPTQSRKSRKGLVPACCRRRKAIQMAVQNLTQSTRSYINQSSMRKGVTSARKLFHQDAALFLLSAEPRQEWILALDKAALAQRWQP